MFSGGSLAWSCERLMLGPKALFGLSSRGQILKNDADLYQDRMDISEAGLGRRSALEETE